MNILRIIFDVVFMMVVGAITIGFIADCVIYYKWNKPIKIIRAQEVVKKNTTRRRLSRSLSNKEIRHGAS